MRQTPPFQQRFLDLIKACWGAISVRLEGIEDSRSESHRSVYIIITKPQKILEANLWEKQATSNENISRTCQASLPPNSLVSFFYL